MLTTIQTYAHFVIGAIVAGCVTALALTNHISGGDALGVFAGLTAVSFVSGTAQNSSPTATVPTVPTTTPVVAVPSPVSPPVA